ncbi:AraC family transcriptional regulator [Paenibacillus doosanensis]|uniref:Arabinose operon regulatory protein n=2 Tax=Paenibacillus konkukensis TaxID=2020716 RepID=A0ABY4RJ70_9BACL|nr:AraC family transcriptional regulator [Paenibacillus doosanensis]MCS7463927.1 AraC family transcriptional regulator [Paenibacillus doosanensis]UQZ82262.1 Arabinose operon regulatory protein [Paenibacillus konkukensis]
MLEDPHYFYRTITHSPSETAKKCMFFVQDVGWFLCSPTYAVDRSFFYAYQIKFVVKGSGYLYWQGRKHKLKANDLFCLDLNREHSYESDPLDPWELLWVRFGGQQAADYFAMLGCAEQPVCQVRNPEFVHSLFRELFEMFQSRPVGLEVAASALIARILSELVIAKMERDALLSPYASSSYPKEVRQAIDYIERHYQLPVRVEEVADHVHLSQYYFARIFKRSTGYSILEYINKYRLTRSKQLLASSKLPTGEVARLAGFCSQSYFTKMFKAHEGMTPKDYRNYVQ